MKIFTIVLRLSSYAVDQRHCLSTELHASLGFLHLTGSICIKRIALVSACSSDFFFLPVLTKYGRRQTFIKQYVKLFLLKTELLKLFIAFFRANTFMLLDH